MVRDHANAAARTDGVRSPRAPLSIREREVLQLFADG
jgi:DNA-binding CsgD family transcriptional regulator